MRQAVQLVAATAARDTGAKIAAGDARCGRGDGLDPPEIAARREHATQQRQGHRSRAGPQEGFLQEYDQLVGIAPVASDRQQPTVVEPIRAYEHPHQVS